jgi:cysteine desulfurase
MGHVNGCDPRLPHVVNVSFEGWRGDELVAALDLEGVRASSGSACSAGTTERSPVVESMVGRARAEGAVRFSLGETTTADDVDTAISVLDRAISRRSSSA